MFMHEMVVMLHRQREKTVPVLKGNERKHKHYEALTLCYSDTIRRGYGMKRKFIIFACVVFLIAAASAFAGIVQLPRTGQTKCYDSAG